MADYQEYRRRILHRRWRRVFIIVALLALVALLSAIGILWKVLHRERVDTALSQNTILRQVTTDNTWNTVNYPLARQLRVQTLEDSTETALDFRMAALPASAPVEKSWFAQVSFVGDSLTQGLQIYDTGLPGAQFCAYKGVGPNAFVNGTSCKRADGVTEIPLDALTAQQPKAVYVLLGSNVLGRDTDYTSFLTYYRLMLDMISQALPDAKIYVQSITPVRPEVGTQANHAGLNRDRLCHINNELAAIALEKNCYFLNLWEVLADENGERTRNFLSAFAKKHDVNIVGGSCAVKRQGKFWNTAYDFDRKGQLINEYDKVHLFGLMQEDRFIAPGNSESSFEIDGIKSSCVICYDIRFPEWERKLMSSGAKILFVSAQWPDVRIKQWEILLRARAIENQAFVVAANRVGDAPNDHFNGHSLIIDPFGEIIANGCSGQEEIVSAILDLSLVDKARGNIPVFKDRRLDLY